MSAAFALYQPAILPWVNASPDDRRFKRIVQRVLIASLLIGIALPWLPVAKPDRTASQELPPRFAKLLLERKPLPPPPPPSGEARPQDVPKEATKPEAPKVEPPKAEAAKTPVPEARKPQPNKPPGEIDNARRRASGVGLLAMKDTLAEIRGAPVAVQMNTDIKQGPGVGSGGSPGVGVGAEPGVPLRNMITSNAIAGSGGINTAGYSRDTGGGGLAGRATTLVEGVAGGGGGGGGGGTGAAGGKGGGGGGAGAGGGAAGQVTRSGSGKASRSLEDVKIVFERNKGAIYAIYNRALRDDPTLQGKVVLELKIAPSGQVVDLRIISSELKTPALEQKLLARIRQFDFGAKDVDAMVVSWPVDFLPS